MPRRPCLRCKVLTTNPSRCDRCAAEYQAQRDAQRGSASARGYTSTYRRTARAVISDHLTKHGARCPGWGVPGHASTDLTVDHVVPLSAGGTHDRANLRVLCRACNSRKRDSR
jgi:5-methylcytosine-specific restriction protein A